MRRHSHPIPRCVPPRRYDDLRRAFGCGPAENVDDNGKGRVSLAAARHDSTVCSPSGLGGALDSSD